MKQGIGCALAVAVMAATAWAQTSFQTPLGYSPEPFAQWTISVSGQPVAAGSATLAVPVSTITIAGGPAFEPLATDVPVTVNDGANTETVTPSAVSCASGVCQITANFAKAHSGNYVLSSGDCGLQEAVNWADSHGGGVVVLDAGYNGPAATTLTGGNSNTLVADARGGAFQWFTWRGSDYGQMWAINGTAVTIGGNNIASFGCSGISAAMVAGTVTVNAGCIYGSRPMLLTEAGKGGTQGILSYTESAGQLVITSSSNTDTSTVAWTQN